MLLLGAPLMVFFFFPGFAIARISSPDCSLTWKWVCMLSIPHCMSWPLPGLMGFFVQSFNSLGQNACTVAAFMMSTCNAGCEFDRLISFGFILYCVVYFLISFVAFTVDPLQPGYSYPGPNGTDNSDLCKCSTVGYSLISACAGCQGEHWIRYDSRRGPLFNLIFPMLMCHGH